MSSLKTLRFLQYLLAILILAFAGDVYVLLTQPDRVGPAFVGVFVTFTLIVLSMALMIPYGARKAREDRYFFADLRDQRKLESRQRLYRMTLRALVEKYLGPMKEARDAQLLSLMTQTSLRLESTVSNQAATIENLQITYHWNAYEARQRGN